jgi:2-polyprenyl-3-methyl-5-hydroxy-6-metoxy-1,4-benzoquinol methylase
MYPLHDLYEIYIDRINVHRFSDVLPDVSKKITLEQMNFAINVCDKWDHCMDIGGGTGHYLAALAGKFKRATLVEVETLTEHAELLKRYTNITIFHEYIEKFQADEKVDFILLADLFEHIPDIKTFVTQLASLQEENGVVYIMTPNAIFCGPAPESGLYHTHHPNGHIKQYTTKEVTRLMNSAGYELEQVLFEEAPLRQTLKRILYALSRRDKNWGGNIFYQIIRPIFLIFSFIIFWLIERVIYRSEINNRNNPLSTKTQDLIFKKRSI